MKQVKWPTTSNKIIQKIVVFCNLWMWPHGAFAGVLSNILLEIRHIHSMHGFRPHFLYTNDNQQIYCRFSKFKTSMRHVERNEMILNNSKNKLLFFLNGVKTLMIFWEETNPLSRNRKHFSQNKYDLWTSFFIDLIQKCEILSLYR